MPHSMTLWTVLILLRIRCRVIRPLRTIADAVANRSGHLQATAHTATAASPCQIFRRNRKVVGGTTAPPNRWPALKPGQDTGSYITSWYRMRRQMTLTAIVVHASWITPSARRHRRVTCGG